MVVAGIFVMAAAYGSDSCSAWLMSASDPVGGKYLMTLQLRSCDLTGGVSAFLQFQNAGTENLKLSYRVYGEDKKILKEGILTISSGQTKRDATCQQCAKRKGGIKTWEILSIDVLPSEVSVTPQQLAIDADEFQSPELSDKVVEPENKVESKSELPAEDESKVILWDQLPPEFRPKNN